MHRYANPTRFLMLSRWLTPVLGVSAALLLSFGLYEALVASPPDYLQGETVRIMYVHVPAAWFSLGIYCFTVGAAVVWLIWRHPLADVAATEAAPIGAVFTAICLVTGSLWGRPTWGTYWVWDARLTSVLVLFFLYLGLIALRNTIPDRERAGKAAAVLAIVGVVNIPIIKFSVEWWHSLHQPASIRLSGSSIHPEMLAPLLLMAGAYAAIFGVAQMLAMRAHLAERRLERRQRDDAPRSAVVLGNVGEAR